MTSDRIQVRLVVKEVMDLRGQEDVNTSRYIHLIIFFKLSFNFVRV
jgi:hypothetical protein